ncbi:hypothetical protein [Amycolatopsis thermophila]|uniref:Sigma E regulatory protein, MucB/RseB n=1 Tax=Amycolatopsis thermophila TaxID=206084 RepID=A0ABU0F6E8_9PSEU|nr:hypothetical protein [Amycolatopsis thermophila]MDQ0382582.1 hypothetical protein [Amycolatopsis thermophila]
MRRERRHRWTVVAAVAAVLLSVPAIVAALRPAGRVLDPAGLRDLVLRSDSVPYQGYARSAGALALPDLPDLSDVAALFAGTTTMHAWYAGPDRYRVAVLTATSERDVYRLPDGEYSWDYGTNTLTAFTGTPSLRLPRASDLLPPDLARWLLRSTAGDAVSALPGRNVAGVAASGLRIVPADPDTAIGQADVWADPASGLPVRVEVTARGQRAPGLVTAFDELDRTAPVVTAPERAAGTRLTVTSAPDVAQALRALGRSRLPSALHGRPARVSGVDGVALYGWGLATFAVVRVPPDAASSVADAAERAGGAKLVLTAGRAVVLSITPLSLAVVQPPDGGRGYLVAGLVVPEVLGEVAGELVQRSIR